MNTLQTLVRRKVSCPAWIEIDNLDLLSRVRWHPSMTLRHTNPTYGVLPFEAALFRKLRGSHGWILIKVKPPYAAPRVHGGLEPHS